MAGDWIKLETTTPDKPEVFRIADELGIDPDAVMGKLLRIWIWADQQTFDGHAGSVTFSLLDRVSGASGFAEAMLKTGWLVEVAGGVTFPNFDRHNGNTAKTRSLATKRKQVERSNPSRSERDNSVTREEKKRGKEKKQKNLSFDPSKADFPDQLRTPAFQIAWASWCQHRLEIRKPMTPTSTAQLINKLSEMGPGRAVVAINHTIEKGWQGLREPDISTSSSGRPSKQMVDLSAQGRERRAERLAKRQAERQEAVA